MTFGEHDSNPQKYNDDNKHEKKDRIPSKIVVRRLPPTITVDSFMESVSPIEAFNYIYIVNGDYSFGEHSFSRVYINFVNSDEIYNFKEKFDNYVFVDNKGHEYSAVVEFAAFQKVPKKRPKLKIDSKCGSIENDPYFIDFVKSLDSAPNQENKPEYSYQPSTDMKIHDTTPLLDFLKQKKIDKQRLREEKKEERKKKDSEKKKVKDDEKKKVGEDKYYSNSFSKEDKTSKTSDTEEFEKPTCMLFNKNKDKKYEDRKFSIYKQRNKYAATDITGNYSKHDSHKNKRIDKVIISKDQPKHNKTKIKKYSERREELKSIFMISGDGQGDNNITALVSEDNQQEILCDEKNAEEIKTVKIESGITVEDSHESSKEIVRINKDNDPRLQRRIRNKDRPTMAIYQPGMLKKKQSDVIDSTIAQ